MAFMSLMVNLFLCSYDKAVPVRKRMVNLMKHPVTSASYVAGK